MERPELPRPVAGQRYRLLFVNRYFYPDHSATSQILSDLVFDLAKLDHEIIVITSRLRYDDTSLLPRRETISSVRINRVRTSRLGRGTVIGRLCDYASFYLSAFTAILRLARKGDIIVAKTDPPLLSVVAAIGAKARGAKLVNWLQDIYPEIAVELGFQALRGTAGKMLRRLRNQSLRVAKANVVIGDLMAEHLINEGIPAQLIATIPNWAEDSIIRPLAAGEVELRRKWGFEISDFIIGYSGNLGRAHEVETLIGAANALRNWVELKFLFIGGGYAFEQLRMRTGEKGLSNFRFHPYQPRSMLVQSLAVADAHWISLRPEMEGLIVPSKVFGIAAAGRPILAIADINGELGKMVAAHGCGIAVQPGDVVGLKRAIEKIGKDNALCMEMGRAARAMLDARFTRRHAVERWQRLLDEIG